MENGKCLSPIDKGRCQEFANCGLMDIDGYIRSSKQCKNHILELISEIRKLHISSSKCFECILAENKAIIQNSEYVDLINKLCDGICCQDDGIREMLITIEKSLTTSMEAKFAILSMCKSLASESVNSS